MAASPHIDLPDWKQCENDTPLFRINLESFHKKMQESVEKFGTLKPTISKITQNLEELERNLEELNLQITSLQKPIFHFNAKPSELNKVNSLRTRNSRQNSGNIANSGNIGGAHQQPTNQQQFSGINPQVLTKPVLPLKPDHFDSLKNQNNSLAHVFHATFFVVRIGIVPSFRLKCIAAPNTVKAFPFLPSTITP